MCTHISLVFGVCVLVYMGCLPVLQHLAEIEFDEHYESGEMVLPGQYSCFVKDQVLLKAGKITHSPVTDAAASSFGAFQSVLAACVEGGHVIHGQIAR